MKFTVHDINEDDRSLMNFIRKHGIEPVGTRVQNRVCVDVFEAQSVIKRLQLKIKQNSDKSHLRRHLSLWNRHIETLRSF